MLKKLILKKIMRPWHSFFDYCRYRLNVDFDTQAGRANADGQLREDICLSGPVLRDCYSEGGELVQVYWLESDVEQATRPEPDICFSPLLDKKVAITLHRVSPHAPEFLWLECRFVLAEWQNSSQPPPIPLQPCVEPKKMDAGNNWFSNLVNRQDGIDGHEIAFALGSCRYPGTLFDRDRSDQIYAQILSEVSEPRHPYRAIDFVLLVGDQIYSDATANVLDPSVLRDRYFGSYHDAWRSKHFRQLMVSVPVHFAVDDHEISDNWSGPWSRKAHPLRKVNFSDAKREQLNRKNEISKYGKKTAQAFLGYQVRESGRMSLWYEARKVEKPFPMFILDTRTERALRKSGFKTPRLMINGMQRRALLNWLHQVLLKNNGDNSSTPAFLVSGVTLAPVLKSFAHQSGTREGDDIWGYPASLSLFLTELFRLTKERREQAASDTPTKQLRNLVLLSGDLHISSVSRITVTTKPENMPSESLVLWQIVSSGLYAPLPFANGSVRDYQWGKTTINRLPGFEIEIESAILTDNPSHFLRMGVVTKGTHSEIKILAIDSAGTPLVPDFPASIPGLTVNGPTTTITLSRHT